MNALSNQRRLQRDRHAFTLVELLVVITIISILSSMTLFTLYGVREDARERRARAQVAKIHEIIMQKWEAYRTRAIPMRVDPREDPRVAAARRLNALRELMRMELPDRATDLYVRNASGAWQPPVPPNSALYPTTAVSLASPPAVWLAYQRRIAANFGRGNIWTPEHQHSECLYMILAATRDGDTTGLDWFDESEIGDTDNDGMLEILDPWLQPIYFLRWAPGFVSDLQDPSRRTPDPFDLMRSDPRWMRNDDSDPNTKLDDPFALFPLIYSAGRDKQYGLVHSDYDDSTNPPSIIPVHYPLTHTEPFASAVLDPAIYPEATLYPPHPWPIPPPPNSIWPSRPQNDPYMILPTAGVYIGLADSSGAANDNISNHFLEVR